MPDKVYEDTHVLAFHDINPLARRTSSSSRRDSYVSWDDFSAKASEEEMPASSRRPARLHATRGWSGTAIACSPIPAARRGRKCRISTSTFSPVGRSARCSRVNRILAIAQAISAARLRHDIRYLGEIQWPQQHRGRASCWAASNRSTQSSPPRRRKSLKRSLGAIQLTLLGIGAVIGTGIFVLTAEAAQKAGPAMMISFVIAGFVCAVAALCYSELAAMVPVIGLGLHLHLRRDGRASRLDGRLGADPRICGRRDRRRGRLVRLCRRLAQEFWGGFPDGARRRA